MSPTALNALIAALVLTAVASTALMILLPMINAERRLARRVNDVMLEPDDIANAPDWDEPAGAGQQKADGQENAPTQPVAAHKSAIAAHLQRADMRVAPSVFYLICALMGVSAYVLFGNVLRFGALGGGLTAIAFGAGLPYLFLSYRQKKKLAQFSDAFPEAMDIIIRGVKAGLPLIDCIKIIAAEAREPVRSEFRKVLEDQTIGLPVDKALELLAERVPISETRFFAIVIAIQLRAGGALSEALGNLASVVRDRKKMQMKIKALSSEAKASAGIIGAMPFLVGGLVYVVSPDYISLLFTERTGLVTMAGSAIWMMIGVLVMRKMINFDY